MHYSPAPMHIPDGFLSTLVSIFFWAISIGILFIALRRTNQTLKDKDVPLMGVLAAAIFAGQMLNFAVTGGTSGHLLGAALATILLGPWAAILTMTVVVSVQALIFQDGGLLALGANIFNMAVTGAAVSYAVYRLTRSLIGTGKAKIPVAGFAAAWFSIFIASLSCALQLALSGSSPAQIAIPAMAGIHALIGIGEGLITAGALVFIGAARPDLLEQESTAERSSRGLLIGGTVLSLLLAAFSPLASSHPDGLEWVAEQQNFLDAARGPFFNLIPDYAVPGIHSETLATILAGVIGVIIVLAVSLGIARNRRMSETHDLGL
ncbi:MAG: energy-coupling factor ABC transporter permease [Anaerolineaceae bacterium]|nr:energy-coupling factor ABC transporter permease [Anaerolineaceae bacterium]